jgi:crotonobetainyl-CoA:carnitine CoA-transferase CaiB-like acyl-CoA transferase
VSMAEVAAACTREGPTSERPAPIGPAVDRTGSTAAVGERVPDLGADTASVLSELGIR